MDGTISGTAITWTLPATADLTKLAPTIALSDKATVSPGTGVAQDFSKEVTYTVTAEDGSEKEYELDFFKKSINSRKLSRGTSFIYYNHSFEPVS